LKGFWLTKQKVEKVVGAKEICRGMAIRLNINQVWVRRPGGMIPFAYQLVIPHKEVDLQTQLDEAQTYLLDIRVYGVSVDDIDTYGGSTMMQVIHCEDQLPCHTIYLDVNESVVFTGEFNPESNGAAKRNKSRNPVAGARRQ